MQIVARSAHPDIGEPYINQPEKDDSFGVWEFGIFALYVESNADWDELIEKAQRGKALWQDYRIRRDGEALGRRIAADEGIEPKADPVPWPTGLCGHPVPPGAWAAGYTRCRDCTAALVSDPENLARFDEAAAPDLTVVDDEDGPQ